METIQVKINNPKAKRILDELADLKLITISEEEIFNLTPGQRKSIPTSRKQIKNGQFKVHKKVVSQMKQWLKTK